MRPPDEPPGRAIVAGMRADWHRGVADALAVIARMTARAEGLADLGPRLARLEARVADLEARRATEARAGRRPPW
jgi:hypothetical protein